MNPNKSCVVPYCLAIHCSSKFKKKCALRKYFLLYQKELRELLRYTITEETQKLIKEKIYYYRSDIVNQDQKYSYKI